MLSVISLTCVDTEPSAPVTVCLRVSVFSILFQNHTSAPRVEVKPWLTSDCVTAWTTYRAAIRVIRRKDNAINSNPNDEKWPELPSMDWT